MKCGKMKQARFGAILALITAALIAGPSSAAAITVNLAAVEAEWTPPGGGTPITMWDFVADPGSCPGLSTWDPMDPPINAAAGDTLVINLRNCLGEPVSFFVPGLRGAATGGTAGKFTNEAGPNGGTASYNFTLRPGTFLYHSATDRVRTQVPMGLYGALVVDSAAGEAYPGVDYDQDEVLVFSEIDPNLNADPANWGGARVINWNPQYFLINGQAAPNTAHLAFTTGSNVLLRLVNAGLETVVPTLEGGLYVDLIAEDANRYPHPKQQYGVELPAGKTIDAMLTVTDEGTYALYDRALRLTNRTATGGGMLTYLDVSAGAGIFELSAATYSVAENGGILTVTVNRVGGSAGAVSVDYATADGTATAGSDYTAIPTTTLNFADAQTSATFDITILDDGTYEGDETFTVSLSNPTGSATLGTPSSAVVTITEDDPAPNMPPVANDDSATTPLNTAVTVNVVANDTDPDGNLVPTTVTVTTTAANGVAVPNGDGTVTYTPNLNFAGTDSFVYQVCDTGGLCDTATVTITVVPPPPNIAPFANDDFAETTRNSAGITFSVTANDVDPDGTIDVTTVVITTGPNTQRGGTVVENNDGTVTYVPKRGFRGTDTFQYTVKDDDGATSNVATVRVNVR